MEDPFAKGLEDLGTVPDRSTIEVLSMLAEDALGDPANVSAVCGTLLRRISIIESSRKLPLLYLLDFISKNLGAEFQTGFAPMLSSVVVSAYRTVSPENQASMRRMMLTWRDQSLYLPQLSEISANVGGLGFEVAPPVNYSESAGSENPAKRQRVDPSIQQMQQYALPGQPQPPGGMMMMMGFPSDQNQFAYGAMPQQMMMPYGGMPMNPQMAFFQQQQQQMQMQQMQHLLNIQQSQLYSQQSAPSSHVGAALPAAFPIQGLMPSGPLLPSRQTLASSAAQPVASSTDISAALLAERNPGVDIAFSLYQGLYFRCSKCALRFQEAGDLTMHANDHVVELKAALVQGTSSRNWYLSEVDWETCRVRHFETMPSAIGIAKTASANENKTDEEGRGSGMSVRVSELSADHPGTCKECGEKLTKRFDDKTEAWVFVGAVFTPPNALAHVACAMTKE